MATLPNEQTRSYSGSGMPVALRKLLMAIAMGFGAGLVPIMAGTVGSIWGPFLVYGVQQLPFPWLRGLIAALFILAGIPLCTFAARELKRKDPGPIVYDEIAAFFVVFAFHEVNWTTGLLGYFYFRLFDMTKPWPCNRLENLPEGVGVMADDLMAGLYAAICLWLTMQYAF